MWKPKRYLLLFGCSLALYLSLNPAKARSQTYTLTSVDVPGAQATVCTDINNAGNVIGFYVDDYGKNHGFLLT